MTDTTTIEGAATEEKKVAVWTDRRTDESKKVYDLRMAQGVDWEAKEAAKRVYDAALKTFQKSNSVYKEAAKAEKVKSA